MSHEKQQLEQQLWNIANTLRGKMDADDFRDYILGFIFYKYLSEKMEDYANTILKPDKITYDEVEKHKDKKEYLAAIKDEALDKLGYFLKPSELFSEMARRGNAEGKSKFILDDLSKVLTGIEQSTMGSESEEDFGNLFEDLDLTSSKLGKTENDKNELIVKVLAHLNDIDFDLRNTENDLLGDAYEYLIGKFASGAGKKAGEFYTPQQISDILSTIVTLDSQEPKTGAKQRLESVMDFACGSGSLLLNVRKRMGPHGIGKIYGQEKNITTYNLARMNMLLHGVKDTEFEIFHGDTLTNEWDKLRELNPAKKPTFDAIVANPPFSLPLLP